MGREGQDGFNRGGSFYLMTSLGMWFSEKQGSEPVPVGFIGNLSSVLHPKAWVSVFQEKEKAGSREKCFSPYLYSLCSVSLECTNLIWGSLQPLSDEEVPPAGPFAHQPPGGLLQHAAELKGG